jgi:predicted RNase H-like HicB family nuclease
MNRYTLIYWKGEKNWLGKILEHPEIMSQGETLEELEENIKDAYQLMVMDDVPPSTRLKKSPYETLRPNQTTGKGRMCFAPPWSQTRRLSQSSKRPHATSSSPHRN